MLHNVQFRHDAQLDMRIHGQVLDIFLVINFEHLCLLFEHCFRMYARNSFKKREIHLRMPVLFWVNFIRLIFFSPNHPSLYHIRDTYQSLHWSNKLIVCTPGVTTYIRSPHMLPIFQESSLQRMRSYTNETLRPSWNIVSLWRQNSGTK